MQSMKDRKHAKYYRLKRDYEHLQSVIPIYYICLQEARKERLEQTAALCEDKIAIARAELNKLEIKITRIKRKIKEKN